MNIAELKCSIISNTIPDFMIFTGEEFGVLNIYLNNIISKLGSSYQVRKLASIKDFIKDSPTKSFFSTNNLYIIRDDNDLLKQESVWQTLKSKTSSTRKLILIYHVNDQRLGFWKHFKDDTVIFDKLSNKVLSSNLNKKYGLSIDKCLILANVCDRDYTRCTIELDKVQCFSRATGMSFEDSFDECFSTIIHKNVEQDIFEFSNSLLTKNFKKSVQIYYIIKDIEPTIKLLSIIYTGFKNVLIAKTIHSAKNIQQNAGINYYQYVKAKEKSGYYTNQELSDILYLIMSLEQGIKTGLVESDFVIEYLISLLS